MKTEIMLLVIAGLVFGAGIVKGIWEYYKDLKDTEQGDFLIPEED